MAFKKNVFKRNNLNKTLDLTTKLRTGKHAGLTCEEVCRKDPEYILWLKYNTNYSLTTDLYNLAVEYKQYVNQLDFQVYEEMCNV